MFCNACGSGLSVVASGEHHERPSEPCGPGVMGGSAGSRMFGLKSHEICGCSQKTRGMQNVLKKASRNFMRSLIPFYFSRHITLCESFRYRAMKLLLKYIPTKSRSGSITICIWLWGSPLRPEESPGGKELPLLTPKQLRKLEVHSFFVESKSTK